MSAFATLTRNTLLEHQLLTKIFASKIIMFLLLKLTVEVENTISNSLLTIFNTSWQYLNKIKWSKLHKMWNFFDKKPVYYFYYFWNIASASLKEVLHVKQLMMLRLFIIRLPSFIGPKSMVVWHFQPSLKSN